MDNWEELEKVLDEWCLASGARFNKNKTEIMPYGTREYRDTVQEFGTMDGTILGERLTSNARIKKDGEATRILGAWIGNGVDQPGVWTTTIEKIDRAPDQWKKGHPTMEGRRLIIQIVIGGMTQYLTKVQGMPKDVEAKLVKRIHNFLWDDKNGRTINRETLYAPLEGGKNILDLEARNEAIDLMWLQAYLKLDEDGP
ncbi:hypothetical protein L218DRAFT_1066742, partial [Marasmius fiardii PR-910]